MKPKFTMISFLTLVFFIMGMAGSNAMPSKNEGKDANPNFRYIDNFEPPIEVSLWWAPQGSGSTTGHILEIDGKLVTYRAFETEIVNPATGSTGSLKLVYMWDEEKPLAPGSHLIRQHFPETIGGEPVSTVEQRRFLPHQAIEVFMYGDGSGNRFRFMTRQKPNNHLKGSQWFTIDWVGWKRITWRLSEDPVIGWANNDINAWDATYIVFDSFQLTWSGQAAGVTGKVYFDDLRIVDPFDINFTVEAAGAAIADAVVSLNGVEYPAEKYDFDLFPGVYNYFVKKDGYLTATGTFEVDDADMTIDVELTTGVDPEYLVTFSVFDLEGELITDAVISIDGTALPAGQYAFDATPGFYHYKVARSGFYPTEGMVTVVNQNVFVNVELIKDPAIFNNIVLSWDVAATATDPQLRKEHYSVWIAEVPVGAYTFKEEDFVKVFEETLGTEVDPWVYQERSVDISWFHNSDVRVAFRHHDVTGMERLVIDNVEITATRTGDTPAIVLSEDFTGGIATPIDPEWLPAGWLKVDADNDGRNWFFAVTNEKAHMISRSRLANNIALSPDNWLVTKEVTLPVVTFYNVTFVVKDQDNNNVEGATIAVNGVALEAGKYVFDAPNGTYQYTVTKVGYEGVSGEVTVAGADKTVNATLNQVRYDVTFRVDIRYKPGFVPGSNTIYISGSFPGINWAVPGPSLQMTQDPDNVYFYEKKMNLPAGTFQYKYFDNTSLDDGEWVGEPFRTVEVTGAKTVSDWYGSLTDPTSVPTISGVSLNLYPNPARNMLNVVAGERILEVRMIDMLGQIVYAEIIEGSNHQINVAGLKNGIYFVQVKTQSGLHTKRIQVVK